MKQRSRSGGKPIKGRRRKTPAKRRNVPNDTPAPNVPNSKNDPEFRRLTRELSEAREQQAATSEVLKAISSSTFDLRTVLDTLLQSAVRLCGADQGTVAQRKGDTFYRSVSCAMVPASARNRRARDAAAAGLRPLSHVERCRAFGVEAPQARLSAAKSRAHF